MIHIIIPTEMLPHGVLFHILGTYTKTNKPYFHMRRCDNTSMHYYVWIKAVDRSLEAGDFLSR